MELTLLKKQNYGLEAKKIVQRRIVNKTTSNSSKNLDSVVYLIKSGKKSHRKGCIYLKSVGGSSLFKEAEALRYEAYSKY